MENEFKKNTDLSLNHETIKNTLHYFKKTCYFGLNNDLQFLEKEIKNINKFIDSTKRKPRKEEIQQLINLLQKFDTRLISVEQAIKHFKKYYLNLAKKINKEDIRILWDIKQEVDK